MLIQPTLDDGAADAGRNACHQTFRPWKRQQRSRGDDELARDLSIFAEGRDKENHAPPAAWPETKTSRWGFTEVGALTESNGVIVCMPEAELPSSADSWMVDLLAGFEDELAELL